MKLGPAVEGKGAVPDRHRASRLLASASPSLLFLVLALPMFSFTFLSDDFNFLLRAYHFRIEQLLPDPRSAFYRPLSRELYFGFLTLVSRNNPFWGHLLNACIATSCIVLVTLIARRLANPRTALLAGLLFASIGPLPLLVGWVSGSQDLFAMLFILGAIALQLRGRTSAALACTAAALFSKESALLFLPGLASLRGVLSRDRLELRKGLLQYGALGLLWGLAHPKVRAFLAHGFSTGAGGYVGLDNSRAMTSVPRELAALLNIPIGDRATQWPSELGLVTIAGMAILIIAFRAETSVGRSSERSAVPRRRVLLLGALLGVVPALLTAASAKHWFPYYACLPAMGTSLIFAVGLEKLGRNAARLSAAAFLILGIWSRGIDLGGRLVPTEQNFRTTSQNLKRVETNLKRLHQSFPDSSRLYVTVQSSSETALQTHLYALQAARVWYANSTLLTDDPGHLHAGRGPEYLFWVTPACDVNEIQLPNLQVRAAGSRPNYLDYQSAVRSLAYGLLGAGEVERAATTLLSMQELDSLTLAFDHRLAATMLLAAGRSEEAEKLCMGLPLMGRDAALQAIAAVLGPEVPGVTLDQAAFRAFGVSAEDPEAYRFLMFNFSDRVLLPQAMRMAERVLSLRPGDEEASAMIEAIKKVPQWEQVVVPVEGLPP